MAQPLPTTRVNRPLVADVYVRRVRGTEPPVNGETEGWQWDPYLRCNEVRWDRGAKFGHAEFKAIPLGGRIPGVEDAWDAYWPDDQVMVVLRPSPDASSPAPASGGWVVFEGALARQPFSIVREGRNDSEEIGFVGVPLPAIEDRLSEHLVRGRPMRDPAEGASPPFFVVESPDVPCVFNFRGRPNMAKAGEEITAASGGEEPLTAPLFTHDGDDQGRWWTVGDALKLILAVWLFGESATPLARMSGVEPETLAAIAGEGSGARWEGLDKRLPETDIRGLGVWGAVDAVCRAGGFRFAVAPLFGEDGAPVADRTYALRIVRRNAGPETALMLPKRGDFGGSAGDLQRANVSRIGAMWDTAATTNEVYAVGEQLIEVSIPLKPLWAPGEISAQAIDDKLQEPQSSQDEYHQRHVAGGTAFQTFGHVGRAWGLDCTGAFVRAKTGYASGIYQHNAPPHQHGFDWVSHLNLAASAIQTDRATPPPAGPGITDPIKWSRRLRRPIRLNRPEAQRDGIDFVLEVSENGGGAWTRVDLQFRVLKEYFGIFLTDSKCSNLAKVNLAEYAKEEPKAKVDESWWKYLQTDQQKVQFRLTCLVAADHAARWDAKRQATSATLYKKAVLVESDIQETWAAPQGFFNTGSQWLKLQGFGVTGSKTDQTQTVKEAAERTRDALEGARITGSADTWLMQPDRWRLLDSIAGIRGREVSFGTSAGNAVRRPEIVGLTWTLHGEDGPGGVAVQGVAIDIDDGAFSAQEDD